MTTEFDVTVFENDLINLKDTQEGIQQMSSWCLQHRNHHKKIVSSWLNVLKQVRVDHRLILFYLANDVIQYSKRKNFEFVDSWGTALQKATTMVRDEKVRIRIVRIFNIWKEREIYSDEYISDLNGLLNMNPIKKRTQHPGENSEDFQTSGLITSLYECIRLSSETDKNFKKLCNPPSCELENLKQTLKDKLHSEDMSKDIHTFASTLNEYIKSLQLEILSRKQLILNIEQADTFFATQRGEVKVVVNAYKNFGARIKNVKKKIEDITSKLMSPMPSPDINAPSPEPDADIILPEDTINPNLFKSSNRYVSYMDGKLPFDINDFKCETLKNQQDGTQAIQVINSISKQKSENNYDDSSFFKNKIFPHSILNSPRSNITNDEEYDGVTKAYNPEEHNYDDRNLLYNVSNSTNYGNSSKSTNMFPLCNIPLIPPPPMPSRLNMQIDSFNSSWLTDDGWSPNKSYDSSIDTPVSPSHIEGLNSNVIEYNERDPITSVQDVDHRHLLLTAINPKKGQYVISSGNGKPIDVDHRNLISLTGSPGIHPPNSEETFKIFDKHILDESPNNNKVDKDYRQQSSDDSQNKMNFDSMKLNPHYQSQMDPNMCSSNIKSKYSTFRYNQNKSLESFKNNLVNNGNDNIESIDMEMSDEDEQLRGEHPKNLINDIDISEIASNSNNKDFRSNTCNDFSIQSNMESTGFIMPKKPENYRPIEFRNFFNPTGRHLQHKHNMQIVPNQQNSQYFNRNFSVGPVRGEHFGVRRKNFQGRSWK